MNYKQKARELNQARIDMLIAWNNAHGRSTSLAEVMGMDLTLRREFAGMMDDQVKYNMAYYQFAIRSAARKHQFPKMHWLIREQLHSLLGFK